MEGTIKTGLHLEAIVKFLAVSHKEFHSQKTAISGSNQRDKTKFTAPGSP